MNVKIVEKVICLLFFYFVISNIIVIYIISGFFIVNIVRNFMCCLEYLKCIFEYIYFYVSVKFVVRFLVDFGYFRDILEYILGRSFINV